MVPLSHCLLIQRVLLAISSLSLLVVDIAAEGISDQCSLLATFRGSHFLSFFLSFFCLLRQIHPELTSVASLPLFCMWVATTA